MRLGDGLDMWYLRICSLIEVHEAKLTLSSTRRMRMPGYCLALG